MEEENNMQKHLLHTQASGKEEQAGVTYDQAIQMVGGFGRFQWYISVVLVLAFMTGGQIVYGLGFLEKYPDYQRLGEDG